MQHAHRLLWVFPAAAKIVAVTGLGLALGLTLAVAVDYAITKRPISHIPGVPSALAFAKQPPHYVQGIYGAGELLASPLGVAATPSGDRVYATESAGERATLVFDRDGRQIGKRVPPGTEPGGRLPLYPALDASGTLYVSDRLRAVIDMYSPAGDYLGIYQPNANPPVAPFALTFDKGGNFYVTDVSQGEHRLLVYGPDGALLLATGKEGAETGEFSFPNGVAVDDKGTIYVSDSNNGRVQILDREGKLIGVIGRGGKGTLGMPRGVTLDPLSRLFIVDTTGQAVSVWDAAGDPVRLHVIGSQGSGQDQFQFPNGIAVDNTGRAYVTDRMNNRVQVWSY